MNAREFRSALAKLGLSQADLAHALDRSKNTVTAWVNADDVPAEARLFLWIAKTHDIDTAKEAFRE
jgi:DNA-binding transcriptional regulator YiaG